MVSSFMFISLSLVTTEYHFEGLANIIKKKYIFCISQYSEWSLKDYLINTDKW